MKITCNLPRIAMLESSSPLLLFPLKEELSLFLKYLEDMGVNIQKSTIQQRPLYHTKNKFNLICTQGGRGKVQFGILSQLYLSNLPNVPYLICAGTAGAIAPNITTGDIIIGEATIEHDFCQRSSKRPTFPANKNLLSRFSLKRQDHYMVHRGIMASGDEDICSTTRAKEIFKQTNALAVAWEGAGGARAANLNKIPFVEIRVISDFATGTTPQDFKDALDKAMKNLSHYLVTSLL
jgi:adenosylhomocysteine nucleosidase